MRWWSFTFLNDIILLLSGSGRRSMTAEEIEIMIIDADEKKSSIGVKGFLGAGPPASMSFTRSANGNIRCAGQLSATQQRRLLIEQ